MPYNGAATINPRPVYAVDHLVVMLPKKMHFTAAPGAAFQAMSDPRQGDAIVQVASNTTVGQPLTFTLSGTGALAETKADNLGTYSRQVLSRAAARFGTREPPSVRCRLSPLPIRRENFNRTYSEH